MRLSFSTIAITLLAMMGSVSAYAADYVKVSEKDGKCTYFALSDKPQVTLSEQYLVLKTERETVNYPLGNVLTFEFANQTTGIDAVDTAEGNVAFTFGTAVKGEGLKPGSRVSVYTVNGQLVGSAVANANGAVEIPLNGQTGVFIVKSLTKTIKFIKK